MSLNYDHIMGLPGREIEQNLTARDTVLYALGVGAGEDVERDPRALRFVSDIGLTALPTQAVVAAYPGFWLREPAYGLDWRRILHAEQSIELHRPFPSTGELRGVVAIDAIVDKGAAKGAILYASRRILDAASGDLLATVRQASFLRGDGGFGGGDVAPWTTRPTPDDRPPDVVRVMNTWPWQALLYRLSGDDNPLHFDPDVAQAAGFPQPILHGLATYGVVGRAILSELCDGDPARLRRFDARFSIPVYPGETLRVEIWRTGPGRAALRVLLVERAEIALQNGYVEFEP